MKNVIIVGCGAISIRHIESIIKNSDNFKLIGFYDTDLEQTKFLSRKYHVKAYLTFEEVLNDRECNLISILTPNSYHFNQSMLVLENHKSVIIEKPVSLKSDDILKIRDKKNELGLDAFCILQVRLNPTVKILQEVINKKLLGRINSVSLIQRWQRPLEYFTGWRSNPSIGGGTLFECGIHYVDILQKIFGMPKVVSSKVYSCKHKHVDIEDTIYSILDYGDFGGTLEVTIASEPTNLECSISVQGSNGFLKLGGKALNIIESYNFLSNGSKKEFEILMKDYLIDVEPNKYGSYQGSCPNHPELYSRIIKNPIELDIIESYNSIKLIEEIYKKSNIVY
jgi:UDP-N-acetyl-2-amino-2-deoxyglucuronate dehydrogenase